MQHLLDTIKDNQPPELLKSEGKLIGKIYATLQQIESTAEVQIAIEKYLEPHQQQGNSMH